MKKVYYNANVITMEKDAMHAQVEAEDMKGKTILPAFFETHMHNLSEGLILRDMNHNECTSIAGLIEYSRNFLATHDIPEGRWVRGRGWNQDNFSDEKRFSTRDDLDKISTTFPWRSPAPAAT